MPRTSRVPFLKHGPTKPVLPAYRRHARVEPTSPDDLPVTPKAPLPADRNVPNDVRIAEVSHYVAQMTAELAHISRDARLDVLAYFLEMARMEAVTALNKIRVG